MNIAIAYDGAEAARTAIADLAFAGLPEKSTAVVMAAADIVPGVLDAKPDAGEQLPKALRNAQASAETAMAEAKRLSSEGAKLVSDLFPHWTVSAEALGDSPFWAFINDTGRIKPDLIVLGTRGRGVLTTVLLGSVSQNVLQYATCSVRIGRNRAPSSGTPIRIVVAFDGSQGAEEAVAAVASRKWPRGTEARVVTAAQGLTLSKVVAEGSGMAENAAARLRSAGLAVSAANREDDPRDAILDEARSFGAHAIFLGARGLTGFKRVLLGSVSGAVAVQAECSVEVVRTAK